MDPDNEYFYTIFGILGNKSLCNNLREVLRNFALKLIGLDLHKLLYLFFHFNPKEIAY